MALKDGIYRTLSIPQLLSRLLEDSQLAYVQLANVLL